MTGNLEITDTYEPTVLKSIRGNLQINGEHISVSAGDVVGDTIYISIFVRGCRPGGFRRARRRSCFPMEMSL